MAYAQSVGECRATHSLRKLSIGPAHLILATVGVLCVWGGSTNIAFAFQEAAVAAPSSGPTMVSGPNGQMIAIDPSTGQPVPGQPGVPGGAEANPGGKKPGEKKEEGKKEGGKGAEGGDMKIITRASRKGEKGDKDELKKAKVDEKGKYRFIFRGQTWPDVLEWFAGESNKNLDWKSLPPDYLNLNVMKQEPSIDELRDILNRHLFMQGYTMFEIDGTLMVVELKSLNPAIVPRVTPEQLKDMPPFSVVKVTIPVPNMIAEEAIKELKPLLSSFNQMSAMKTTNRIEVIDTVVTLRELLTFVNKEQVKEVREVKFREFILKHGVAVQVRERLMALLGIEDRNRRSQGGGGGGGGRGDYMQMQMEMQMQMQQQQMQQMQQQQGGGGGKGGAPKPEIYFVADERRNSIYVHAPVDRMPEIEKLIEMIDAPSDAGDSILANPGRMQTYTLSGADPETLIKSINDLCVLEPQTKLYVLDKKSRTFVAYASMQDHMTIRALVKKLDTTGRKPYVIYLKRLPAEVVAVSIDFLMNGEKEKKNNNRSYMYDYFGYGSNRNEDTASNDKFRVVPDIEHNRLLLRANPTEYEEIQDLLAKLGEIPDPANGMNKQRSISLPDGLDREEFMRKLKILWPRVSPNPLDAPEIPSINTERGNSEPSTLFDAPKADPKAKPAQSPTTETNHSRPPKAATEAGDKTASDEQIRSRRLNSSTFAVFESKAVKDDPRIDEDGKRFENQGNDSAVKEESAKKTEPVQNEASISPEELLKRLQELKPTGAPPVKLAWGIDGQLIISSDDPEALNQLEELLGKLTPQVPEHFVIQLSPKASAFSVAANLRSYFKEEEKKENNARNVYYFDNYNTDSSKDDPLGKITKRRPVKFIDDWDTNTIIVVGANARQIEMIKELVKIYDKATPADPQAGRHTQPYTLKYNKAKVVAEAVKEVYRELLSSKDRAMQNPNDKKAPAAGTTILFGDTGSSDGSGEKRTQVTFNGRLSIGIDEHSNTLLVSTDGGSLMQNVMKLIVSLDEAARPARTQLKVVQLGAGMTDSVSRKALAKALQDRLNPQQPNQQQQNLNQQNNPQNPNGIPNNGGQVVAPEGGE